jgi:type I restriction enzyme S subunit
MSLRDLVGRVLPWRPSQSGGDEVFEYIDLGAVDQKIKSITNTRTICVADAPSRARQLLAAGDVLVSTVRPNLNSIAQVDNEHSGAVASTGFCVLRSRKSVLDPDYLFQWVKSSGFVQEMTRKATGASYPAVSDRIVLDSRIPLPEISEQSRIAKVLSRADSLMTARLETLAKLDDLVQTIFLDMFGDPLENSKGWRVRPLGELTKVARGASPRPKGDPRYFGGRIPWLKISDVTRSIGRTVTDIREGVTEAGRGKSVYLQAGTLVLTNSATVGIPKILGVGACIHDGFLALLEIDISLDRDFLYGLFEMMRDRLLTLAPEGTQKNLNTKIVKAIEIPIPPIELQREFACRVEAVERLKVSQRAHLVELDALFASLQYRAFRGEL